jgi:hypothetical protein
MSCKASQIVNPDTGRCVSKRGAIGKRLVGGGGQQADRGSGGYVDSVHTNVTAATDLFHYLHDSRYSGGGGGGGNTGVGGMIDTVWKLVDIVQKVFMLAFFAGLMWVLWSIVSWFGFFRSLAGLFPSVFGWSNWVPDWVQYLNPVGSDGDSGGGGGGSGGGGGGGSGGGKGKTPIYKKPVESVMALYYMLVVAGCFFLAFMVYRWVVKPFFRGGDYSLTEYFGWYNHDFARSREIRDAGRRPPAIEEGVEEYVLHLNSNLANAGVALGQDEADVRARGASLESETEAELTTMMSDLDLNRRRASTASSTDSVVERMEDVASNVVKGDVRRVRDKQGRRRIIDIIRQGAQTARQGVRDATVGTTRATRAATAAAKRIAETAAVKEAVTLAAATAATAATSAAEAADAAETAAARKRDRPGADNNDNRQHLRSGADIQDVGQARNI